MSNYLFDGWPTILQTLIVGIAAYIFLVFFLRISGKRTLSKMNMFDFIVTVAFGSSLATVILSKDVSLSQGVTGLGLLVLSQFCITYIGVRSPKFKSFIKSTPSLLYFKGNFYANKMIQERVSKDEIKAALRQKGYTFNNYITAVILETDGSISILTDESLTLKNLRQEGVAVKD